MRICLFFAMFAFAANAEVVTRLFEDEMTGESRFVVALTGETVTINSLTSYEPALVFGFNNPKVNDEGRLCFKPPVEIAFRIQTEGFKRNMDTMSYKVGTNDIVKAVMNTSDDRRSAFVPRSKDFMDQLKESDRVLFRFTTTLGVVRTLKFTGIHPAFLREATMKWISENPGKLKKCKK